MTAVSDWHITLWELFSVPFAFLLPGAVVAGDFLSTWQYSWASCSRHLCCLTCYLFYVFPPSHLPLFLSPSCPSHLPVCVGGEQLGTGKACYNMKPLFQYHKSHINGEQRTGCSLRIHLFASRMLLFPSCDTCLSEVKLTRELQVWDQWWEWQTCLWYSSVWYGKILDYFFFLLAFYDSTLSIIYRIHLYKSEWVFSKRNCLRPFENRHFKIFLNKKQHYAQTDSTFVKVAFSEGRIGQRTTHRKVGLISNLYSKE